MKKFLASLFFSFLVFSCTTNKVAGRSSFNIISAEQEVKMGEEAYRQILSEQKLSKNPNYITRLKKVSDRLVKVVSPDIPNAQWEFNVIESDEVNAFALPGGKVAIYTGLLKILNDDELAYVIGHEVSHVALRHGSERISQQIALQMGAEVASVLLKNKSKKNSDIFLLAFGLGSQIGITLPYSRKNEYEADKFGALYAAKAGYDPEAAITTLQKFQELSGGKQPLEFLSTHPINTSRIKALKKDMETFKAEYYKSKSSN